MLGVRAPPGVFHKSFKDNQLQQKALRHYDVGLFYSPSLPPDRMKSAEQSGKLRDRIPN